jgi:hypothetical protein
MNLLTIEIECGKTTCAIEKGKFCKFLKFSFTNKNLCVIFGGVEDKNGWIQRHAQCLKKSTKGEKPHGI